MSNDTLTRTEIQSQRSHLGDVILQRDKVGHNGRIVQRDIVMWTQDKVTHLELAK